MLVVVTSSLVGAAGLAGGVAAARSSAHSRLPAVSLPRAGDVGPLLSTGPSITRDAAAGASIAASGRLAVGSSSRRTSAHLSVSPSNMTYQGGHFLLRWSTTGATYCTLSASPRFWRGPNPARVYCHGKLSATFPAVALGGKWKFTLKASKGKRGKAASVRRTFTLHAPPFKISSNWAGYAISPGTPITEVSGRFTVPRLNCKNSGTEAMWVGIGGAGAGTGDLLQTGVESTCSGGVQVVDPAWWEEFPEYHAMNFNSMSVSPGDQIQASVYQANDSSWYTRLDDLTTGVSGLMHTGDAWGTVLDSAPTTWHQQEGDASTVAYGGGSSADWIIEDPQYDNGTQAPLVHFGTVAFANLTTSLPSWSLTPDDAIGLGANNGLLFAAPSAPAGNAFSVTYTG